MRRLPGKAHEPRRIIGAGVTLSPETTRKRRGRSAAKARTRHKGPAKAKPASRTARLEEQLAAVRAIGEALSQTVGVDALLERVVVQVTKLMRATRSTLFLYDADREEIWSKVAEGANLREIRLPVGAGVAGWVAKHHKTVLVRDAYDDERFDRSVDLRTGFRTRSIAAAPLLDPDKRLLGVVQVLNRKGGPFTNDDIGLLTAIAAQISAVLENARLSDEVLRRNRELDLLLALEQEASANLDTSELLAHVSERICAQLRARAGAALLLNANGQATVYRYAAGKRELTVEAAADDSLLSRATSQGMPTSARHAVCVPLIWDRHIVGAFEVSEFAGTFSADDVKTLIVAAGQLARVITYAQERTQRSNDQRLTAIGRMLAGVAHDMRTPMTVISGHAQLMIEEEDPRQRIERCSRILGQIEEMVAMIGDLLAFARGDSNIRRSHVELDAFCAELQQTIMPLCAPRGISLQIEPGHGVVLVDLGRTKRIIHNLAKNAIDVMTRGAQLHIALTAEHQGLHIVVRDQGKGMDDVTQAHLFEPFFTDKSDGTGLGLTIVKRFVDDHGGSIRVKSAEGSGTTVEVLLPHATRSENDTV